MFAIPRRGARLLALVLLIIPSAGLVAAEATHKAEAGESIETVEIGGEKVVRVGGNYQVKAIERVDGRNFLMTFVAETASGRFDVLRLSSDHVHVAVREGQKVRLSAEILTEKGAEAEVSQVVLFLPSAVGRLPVWLLSNKAPNRELRSIRYLEMHAPLNDYQVM